MLPAGPGSSPGASADRETGRGRLQSLAPAGDFRVGASRARRSRFTAWPSWSDVHAQLTRHQHRLARPRPVTGEPRGSRRPARAPRYGHGGRPIRRAALAASRSRRRSRRLPRRCGSGPRPPARPRASAGGPPARSGRGADPGRRCRRLSASPSDPSPSQTRSIRSPRELVDDGPGAAREVVARGERAADPEEGDGLTGPFGDLGGPCRFERGEPADDDRDDEEEEEVEPLVRVGDGERVDRLDEEEVVEEERRDRRRDRGERPTEQADDEDGKQVDGAAYGC